jgi:hypothetical protein
MSICEVKDKDKDEGKGGNDGLEGAKGGWMNNRKQPE